MYAFLLAIHILVCLVLVVLVLMQSGKGGGLAGGAFGGSAQTVFGGRGATDIITRATVVLGVVFFVTSIVLSLMASNRVTSRSLIQEEAQRARTAAPAPAPAPVTPAPAGEAPPAGDAPGGGAGGP